MDKLSAATARAYDRLRVRHPAEFLKLVASEYGSSVTNPPRATRLGFSAPMREDEFKEKLQQIRMDEPGPRRLEDVLREAIAPAPVKPDWMAPTALTRETIEATKAAWGVGQLLEPAAGGQAVEPTPVEPAAIDETPAPGPAEDIRRTVEALRTPLRLGLDGEGKLHATKGQPGAGAYALCGALLGVQETLATRARVSCYKCRAKL